MWVHLHQCLDCGNADIQHVRLDLFFLEHHLMDVPRLSSDVLHHLLLIFLPLLGVFNPQLLLFTLLGVPQLAVNCQLVRFTDLVKGFVDTGFDRHVELVMVVLTAEVSELVSMTVVGGVVDLG